MTRLSPSIEKFMKSILKKRLAFAMKGRSGEAVIRQVSILLCLAVFAAGCFRQPSVQPPAGSTKDSTTLAETPKQAVAGAEISLTYEQRQGKYVYTKYCAVCHGEQGKGDGFNAYNLDPKPRDFTDSIRMGALTDEQIIQTISGGGRSVNKSTSMPSWGGRLSKDDLRYVTAYVRYLGPSR